MQNGILLGGAGDRQIWLDAAMANRHGLITGATGTGKTVSLQLLAESFSRLGVPVFAADIKGDLSGVARPGSEHPKVAERVSRIGISDHGFEGSPVLFWDVRGEKGHPVRTTVSEMGPVLLSNLLELNETQEGVLQIAFSLADDQGLLLLDLMRRYQVLLHQRPAVAQKGAFFFVQRVIPKPERHHTVLIWRLQEVVLRM